MNGDTQHKNFRTNGNFHTASGHLTENTSKSSRHQILAPCTTTINIFFSIVLLALVSANYQFLYIDVGSCGRSADGGVFNNSSLAQALETNSLMLPPAESVADVGNLPYVMVADDAFALKTYLLKPYAARGLTTEQRIFNYRLSRARRVAENAFGILSNRFQIFKKAIQLSPAKVEVVTLAACCLHNFLLRDQASAAAYTADLVDGNGQLYTNDSVAGMQDLAKNRGNRSSHNASEIRDKFCTYFNSPSGTVSWQSKYC